jgi:hypothetical protein
MLEIGLLESIAKNYDEIKVLLENNNIDQLKDYILERKQSLLDHENLYILDTFTYYCEEYYPQFQSILSRLKYISHKTEYNKVDYLLKCKSLINFNNFNIGTSYYGGKNGDNPVKIIINDKDATKPEVLKIMDRFDLDHDEYGNFLKYLITIADSYWHGDVILELNYYDSYLPDGYKF